MKKRLLNTPTVVFMYYTGIIHVLSTIYDEWYWMWRERQYFKIIAWYFIDEHTSDLDSNSFRIRKISTFDLIYYITLSLVSPDENQSNHKAIQWRLSNGRFPMERRDHCLRYLLKDMRHFTSLHDLARISICEGALHH